MQPMSRTTTACQKLHLGKCQDVLRHLKAGKQFDVTLVPDHVGYHVCATGLARRRETIPLRDECLPGVLLVRQAGLVAAASGIGRDVDAATLLNFGTLSANAASASRPTNAVTTNAPAFLMLGPSKEMSQPAATIQAQHTAFRQIAGRNLSDESPPIALAPTAPSTETGWSATVRFEPPIKTLAPTPTIKVASADAPI